MTGFAKRLESLRESVDRHGWLNSMLRYADGLARRLISYGFCRIESNATYMGVHSDPEGYATRAIESDYFYAHRSRELDDADFSKAFARGDVCIASLKGSEVVGFTFYTRLPTAVNAGVVFRFPSSFLYAYGSMTAPSHRGKKLESTRWKAEQNERLRIQESDTPRIFYREVTNSESNAANRGFGSELIGYSGFLRIAGRWFCYRSPGCRRVGAGFWPLSR